MPHRFLKDCSRQDIPKADSSIERGRCERASIRTERGLARLCIMAEGLGEKFARMSIPKANRIIDARRRKESSIWIESNVYGAIRMQKLL
jgi:hypothetical protein